MKNNSKKYIYLRIFFSLSIIINAFILINAFIPGDESATASFWVADILAKIINFFKADAINSENIESFSYVVRKLVGHFGLFLCDALFVSITFYSYHSLYKKPNLWFSTLLIFLVGGFFASISEMIQVFIPGRVGSFEDVLIDMSGYFLALLVIFLIYFFKQRSKKLPIIKK